MFIWQTKKWQEMLVKSHQIEKYFEIDGVFIEKRKVAFGEYGLFVIGAESGELKIESFTENLIKLCKEENALFVQVETLSFSGLTRESFKEIKQSNKPKCCDENLGSSNNENPCQARGLKVHQDDIVKKGYYKKFITPYTAVIDLTKSEDEILAGMKQKGRYNIRLAEKRGVEVKEVEKSKENVKVFYDLMLETTKRDSFHGNSLEYYFNLLSGIDDSKLLFASYEGKIVSAGIFVYEDEVAIYYYGASTSDEKFRNLMSPYLLQWNAILIGKKLNCKIYDFLGVATPGDKKSKLVGVTDFKMKFTQDVRRVSESYIFVNKKLKYRIIRLLRKLKKV